MNTQSAVVKTASHLFLCPHMQLDNHDVSVSSLFFFELDNQSKFLEWIYVVRGKPSEVNQTDINNNLTRC